SHELNNSAAALGAEARYAEVLRNTGSAEKAFGDLKYWLMDLAVSLLNLPEQRANEARRALDEQLTTLQPYDPASVAVIRHEVEELMGRALSAVDAYADEHRVIGNALMAQARVHIAAVDQTLSQLVGRLKDDAAKASDSARRQAAEAVRLAWIIEIAAIVVGLALTLLVLRSIVVPLGRIGDAIDALTGGRTDIPIPRSDRHEIGAIARTLSLFRHGLVERNRPARRREQARA